MRIPVRAPLLVGTVTPMMQGWPSLPSRSPARAPQAPRLAACFIACAGALTAAQPSFPADDGVKGVTAVASKVSTDYVRARLPDGSFQPEFYAFGEGGNWGGQLSDATIDKMNFMDVARVIAGPLEAQKFLPARDPARTRLLIMVYWGTTAVPDTPDESPLYQQYYQDLEEFRLLMDEGNPDEANAVLTAGLHILAMANRERDRIDFKNAKMIGYDADDLVGTDHGKYLAHTALGWRTNDEVSEIEENRYFVVLMAYDFQIMWKQKKHKLLWETRFSINERHNQFDRALPEMAQYASRYFGQPTNGLLRTGVPEGNVEVREPTLIEFLSGSKK